MSRMLTMIDAGWESVRTAVARGRRAEALTRVVRLLNLPDLPAPLAAEAHRLAGELLTEAESHARARRHLRTAAGLEPGCARTFYLWGLAFETDPHGCDRRAALRFRRAAELEPANDLYRAAFGRAALRAGRTKTGLRALLAAAKRSAGEMAVVRIAVDGLLEAGYLEAARGVITRARFLRPGDRELGALWETVRFESARAEQRGQGGTTRRRQDAAFARDGGRVVLPFVRVVGGAAQVAGMVRRDALSVPRPHFPRLRAGKGNH